MFDWAQFTLFLFIIMRMSGFVIFSPIFGRRGIPNLVIAGFILVLSVSVASMSTQVVAVPTHLLDFALRLCLELFLGYGLGLATQMFFYIPQLAGEAIDTQLGFSMGKTYDPGAGISMSVTSTFLNIFMFLLFFAANGHHTLLRILLTSGDLIPFGQASFGPDIAIAITEIFVNCTLLAIKLALPILAAELMGQFGMGILMKAIPQINVFAINIELKVIIGLTLTLLLITPFSQFLLTVENQMLGTLQELLRLSS